MKHLFLSKLVLFTLLFRVYSEGDSSKKGPKVTVNVWFDIAIGDAPPERGTIGLFVKTVPKTVDSFVELSKKLAPEGYKNSKFHRIIKDFIIQGDFKSETSLEDSVPRFADENFKLKHCAFISVIGDL